MKPVAADTRLEAAEALLAAGRVGQAVGDLRQLIAERPDFGDAHELLATALARSGDRVAAESALRAALTAGGGSARTATRLAALMLARRDASGAAGILAPFVDTPLADSPLLTIYGAALKLLGRHDEAVEAYAKAARLDPESAVAEHNLAGALGDAHRYAESADAAGRALNNGLKAPETWLVQGRAFLGLREFDAAEAAFREAIGQRSGYADAHSELAQLIWMRTEDLGLASEPLNAALSEARGDVELSLAKARLLEYAGDPLAGYDALGDALLVAGANPRLLSAATLLILDTDPELALQHAERAVFVAGQDGPPAAALCQANLALGRADIAAAIAEDLCRKWPLDQFPVTLAATAWRILGDPRYRELYDYERLVQAQTIETPAGWATLQAFLADLAAHLRALQELRAHPIGQSLRQGTQTAQSLARSDDPTILAFFAAIDAPIRAYIQMLAERRDLLGSRVTSGYRFSGAWSVLLRPGGRHVDHIHPLGWISSAFHVELPASIEDGHQGWLKFGEPGVVTSPRLGPEHFVKPKAGDLVLFPSYMWHGTVAFGGDAPRLAAAFDVLPA